MGPYVAVGTTRNTSLYIPNVELGRRLNFRIIPHNKAGYGGGAYARFTPAGNFLLFN